MNDIISQTIAFIFGAISFLGMFFAIYSIVAGVKLKRHQKEWFEIKSGIPIEIFVSNENGIVKAELSARKQRDAYLEYCDKLKVLETGSYAGCCFPRFGKLAKEKTVCSYANGDEEKCVRLLIEILHEEFANQRFVVVDQR